MSKKQKILIVGGGFAGIKTALELAGHDDFRVSLLSDQENFRFYPTLYRAAMGGKLTASSIPLTEIFAGHNVKLIKDTALSIDRKKKSLKGKSDQYDYDVLVLALGVTTNFFGIKGLKQYAYGIKSVEEAVRLRDHLHKHLVDSRKPDVNYVVIGGGPTGVELAGALPGYMQAVMERHELPPSRLHIDLVEAAPRLMPRMSKAYSRSVQKRLRRLGVRLYLKHAVEAQTPDALDIGDHSLKSHTVVWTAGVTNHSFFKDNDFDLSEHGKVVVNQFLEAETDIYVIGDNADTPYSGLAQTAVRDGKFLADNLKRQREGKVRKGYKAKRPVYVTPVGPRWAAVQWGNLHIYGLLGWLLRGMADLIAYHDLEPWWKASQHWIAEAGSEESCPVCRES